MFLGGVLAVRTLVHLKVTKFCLTGRFGRW